MWSVTIDSIANYRLSYNWFELLPYDENSSIWKVHSLLNHVHAFEMDRTLFKNEFKHVTVLIPFNERVVKKGYGENVLKKIQNNMHSRHTYTNFVTIVYSLQNYINLNRDWIAVAAAGCHCCCFCLCFVIVFSSRVFQFQFWIARHNNLFCVAFSTSACYVN